MSDIEVRRGGGAYICGEETALFESIEQQQKGGDDAHGKGVRTVQNPYLVD